MAAHKLPAVGSFWERHERLVLEVFLRALESLEKHSELPTAENDLSDLLAVATRKAAFDLGLDYPPKREVPIQPVGDNDIGGPASGKRPDFTCEVRDIAATSSRNAWLDYHIECKCLGEPSSQSWIYNRNYVNRGIRRFLDPEHRYGEGAPSGAMIGYVLSMSFGEILEDVNGYLGEPWDLGSAPPIHFPNTQPGGIAQTSQSLARARFLPRQFTLRHLWVDLRKEPNPQ